MKTANPGKKPSKLRQMFGSRFKAGSYSAFAAAVVIAIAVLANLAVQALPQTATQIDLTAQSLYTLSDQTRRIAASLDTDVNLYLLALRGNEDDTISRLLQSYAELTTFICPTWIPPSSPPFWTPMIWTSTSCMPTVCWWTAADAADWSATATFM